MNLELELGFQKKTLSGEYYISLFNQFVRFSPISFTKKHTTKEWDEKIHLKMIAKANNDDSLIIGGDKWNIFLTTDTGTKVPHRTVAIIQDKELFFPKDVEVEKIIERDGFIYGYLYNADYVDVQSTVAESNLKGKNFPTKLLETIKNTPWKQGVHCREFDTRFNPGRKILIGGTWLVAAWKMWFGQPFFEMVPKEKLLAFPYASHIRELPSGKVFIQLFDDIEKSHTKENMFIQWKWQEWIDYDSLIAKYQ